MKMCHHSFARLSLLLVAMLLGGYQSAQAADPAKAAAAKANLCEISSAKAISYKLATGPWLSREAGTAVVALPIEVRTAEVPCRIKLNKQGYLQVLPQSNIQLKADDKSMVLTVKKGAAYYGLFGGVTMKVTAADGRPIAEAGSAAPAKGSRTAISNMGLVQVVPGATPIVDLTNIQGQARQIQDNAAAKDINAGQKLRFDHGTPMILNSVAPPASRPVAANSVTAATAPAAPSNSATSGRATAGINLAASAAPLSAQMTEKVLLDSYLAATDDDLTKIAPPAHTDASPWMPPPRNRGPLPGYIVN